MICAIVLAAGRSQRMGTQKLLLPFAGSTVIVRMVDAFLGAPVRSVVVVVRPQAHQLRNVLAGRPVLFAENPDSAGDMLSSLRCGLRALPSTAETILVSPADQPSIEPDLIRQMLVDFEGKGGGILVPIHNGRRGHPLVFAARYRDELLNEYDGVGLRGLLQHHACTVIEWPTDDAAVLEDLDTPADYQRAQSSNATKRSVPFG